MNWEWKDEGENKRRSIIQPWLNGLVHVLVNLPKYINLISRNVNHLIHTRTILISPCGHFPSPYIHLFRKTDITIKQPSLYKTMPLLCPSYEWVINELWMSYKWVMNDEKLFMLFATHQYLWNERRGWVYWVSLESMERIGI